MNNHVIEDDKLRWLFGWDQKNRSYFLTKYDKSLPEEVNPVFQWGTGTREIPDPDLLFVLAEMVGLYIPEAQRGPLYRYKDFEKASYFVVFPLGDFVRGFRMDYEAHAESLWAELQRHNPNQLFQIRKVTGPVDE